MKLNPFTSKTKLGKEVGRREVAERATDHQKTIVKQQDDQITKLKQEVAEAPYRAREELIGQYGIRIGWKDFDLQRIQVQARVVEPSIRIEREDFRWVFFAARVLDEAQMRRLESKIGFSLERG